MEGNGHTISGLNNALFAGGFAGTSGIVIKDLTLDKMTINDSTNTQGIGAFICNVDSMPKIDLVNCHLTNSTITSTAALVWVALWAGPPAITNPMTVRWIPM